MPTSIEFTSIAQNGIINIPEEYRNATQGELRVIIVPSELSPTTPPITAIEIQRYLDEHPEVHPFESIENAVEWQRKTREEWEREVH